MTSDELYDLFRKDVVDVEQPYLWSDTEVYAYMNDAYFMFVRLTGGIADFNSSVCQIPVVANQKYAALDPSILRIRTASRRSDGRELRIINIQDSGSLMIEDYGRMRTMVARNRPGPIEFMIIGEKAEIVQWINIPTVNDTVDLFVERLPLEPIIGDGQEFEGVQAQHHLHFLKWMEYLAYNKMDSDSYDPKKSEDKEAEFYNYCELAKREKETAKHKTRVVAYGGI